MEQIKDISSGESTANENSEVITHEMIYAKGAEADAAWKEVERIIAEIEIANDEEKTPSDEVGKAALEKLIPEYKAASAKERALEDEWMSLIERQTGQ